MMSHYYKRIYLKVYQTSPPNSTHSFQTLGDCEKLYYHAIATKGYSYNELVFIISQLFSALTKKR